MKRAVIFNIALLIALTLTACKTSNSTTSIKALDSPSCGAISAPPICAWYDTCLEDTAECGETGYPIGYGKTYCNLFAAVDVSDPCAHAWRDSTMKCLQKQLVDKCDTGSKNCSALRAIGFDSHPTCYTREPYSVCFLPWQQTLKIMSIVHRQDYW